MPWHEGPRKLDYATPDREEEPRKSRIPPVVVSLGKVVLLLAALIGATWLLAYVLSIVNPMK
jgi:hypothetical protein